MKAAVVGHVEWVDFVRVDRLPRSGAIAAAADSWAEAAGGGAVVAREFLRLGAETTFFSAFGADELGAQAADELRAAGLRLEHLVRDAPQRRCFTFVEANGERTITTIGAKLVPHAADPLPWEQFAETDAVYFCGGDVEALRLARRARVLVATARELPTLAGAGVELDALVHSGRDSGERYRPGDLDPTPRLVATTEGRAGGRFAESGGEEGRWEAAPLPAPLVDVYGAGDCFAAGLAFALAENRPTQDALAFAAARAALAMTRRGSKG